MEVVPPDPPVPREREAAGGATLRASRVCGFAHAVSGAFTEPVAGGDPDSEICARSQLYRCGIY